MTDKPYIDPNSGAASQPGGLGRVSAEVQAEDTVEQDVSTQIQDDPAGQDAVDPDPDAEPQDELAERTGEVTTGDGETVVTPEQAQASEDPTFSEDTSGDTPKDTGSEGVAGESEAPEAYDPGAHNVDEVLAYISANPDEKDAILEAEAAGRKRKTILDS